MTQQTGTGQGLGGREPLSSLPGRLRPRPSAAPGRSPAGDAAGGEEQRCRRGHLGPVHRLTAAASLGIPKTRARGAGRGRGSPAAAAAARGGREWGAVAGARLMTSQPGCGSAGARTWLRRRPRAALGPERPAPSSGAARQSARSAGTPAGPLKAPGRWGPPPIQPPSAELQGSPASGGAKGPGGSRKALREPPGGATPNLSPPRAPPRCRGSGRCSPVSYCLQEVGGGVGGPRTLEREHREGPSVVIGVLGERAAHPSPSRSDRERSAGERSAPQT